jgi:glycosyltransferase involved in cell wall biosynthesis
MHIEICRTHYPHWGAFSGINQFLKYVDKKRFSIGEQLVSDSDEDFPFQSKIVRKCLRDFIQMRGMEWYKLSDLVAEVKILCNCLKGRVDIVHYLDGEHSAQFLPIVLKRLGIRKPRFIGTFHQPPDLLDSLLSSEMIQKLDLITVVSPDQIAYFRNYADAQRIRLILHGVDTNYFSPGFYPKSNQTFKCITVGHYLRDFSAIAKVARKLAGYAEIEFHLVSACTQGLDQLSNIKVHKNVNDSELLELYRNADVLFLPLIQSTANNSLLEGIACGLPVISTMLNSVNSYVPGTEAVLVMDNDPGLLADSIINLFENPETRLKMGEAARARAKQLSWQKIGPMYEALYSELYE